MRVFWITLVFLNSPVLHAVDSESCNRSIAKKIYWQAKKRCAQKGARHVERIIWSEKEMGITRKGKSILGGAYFQCSNRMEYLALAEIDQSSCQLRSLSLSHTSEVPDSYIEN